jgi:hypothetical protein
MSNLWQFDNYNKQDTIMAVVLGLLIVIVIYLLKREWDCWYWKINDVIELLCKSNQLIEQLAKKTDTANGHHPSLAIKPAKAQPPAPTVNVTAKPKAAP